MQEERETAIEQFHMGTRRKGISAASRNVIRLLQTHNRGRGSLVDLTHITTSTVQSQTILWINVFIL
jgi:hypothetical protein